MSTTIDQRVVEMRFDNKQFESGVSQTMSTLDKFKKSLNLDGAVKGLEGIGTAAKGINLSSIGSAAEAVGLKFNAMYSIADQALRNIVNSAMQTGERIAKALTIDPIKMGFSEYETQINAVQTILANTSHAGTNLEDVSRVLDDLNTYADKTIYNFTEMTRNIGTFTAAGLGLDESAEAIKGIANLAAVSGSTSQQASTAMYQLSQALANGTVNLQDWNSVVNAGMGGKVFQDALVRTAAAMKGVSEEAFRAENITGSFRESIGSKDGSAWLTAEVLSSTLRQFTGDLSDAQLAAMGFSKEQIKNIQAMAVTANDAATKVKTVTQLWDTLKESAQSGWTQSWEIVIGDFEEAKELLTEVSDTIGGMLGDSAEARNLMLQGWKDLGGRTDLIDAIRNAFEGVLSVAKPIKEAFTEIFPPITAKQLANFTKSLKDLTEKMKLSNTASDNLKRTFKGVFAIFDIGKKALVAVFNALKPLFAGFGDLSGGLLGITASWGDWLVNLDKTIAKSDIFAKTLSYVSGFIEMVVNGLKKLVSALKDNFVTPGIEALHGIFERFSERMDQVGKAASDMKFGTVDAIKAMGDAVKNSDLVTFVTSLWEGIKELGRVVSTAFSQFTGSLVDKVATADFKGIIDLFNAGAFAAIAAGIVKFQKSLSGAFDGFGDILEGVVGVLDGVKGSLEAYQNSLKADTLMKIASAIAVLTASVVVLSLIDSAKLSESLGAITMLFADLMGSMAVFSKLSGAGMKGVIKTTTMMLGLSTAVLILAAALKTIGDLEPKQLATGVLGIVGLTATIVAAAKVLGSGKGTVLKGATQMVIFAAAIKVLASVAKDMAEMNWDQMKQGLAGVGILMAEVAAFLFAAKFGKLSLTTATGVVVLAAALKVMASACADFSTLNSDQLKSGLTAIGVVLAEVAAFMKLTGNAKGVLSTGVALVAIGGAMKIFASAIKDLSGMTWEELARGLTGMAGALAAITLALNFMPKNMLGNAAGLIGVSAALVVLSEVLNKLGGMGWESIAKGLVALGGALGILAIGLHAMNGTLGGSAALLVASAALAVITPVLYALGSMSWESIAKGLVAIAGAIAVLGVAGAVLGPLVPSILGLAASFTLLGVGALAIGAALALIGTGLSAIAVGFTALVLSVSGGAAAIVSALTVIVTGILNLIPAIIATVGEVIVGICAAIAESAPAIGEAVKALVVTLVDVLVECVPLLVTGALELLSGLLDGIAQYAPKIVDSLFELLVEVIEVLTDRAPQLVSVAMNFIGAFFSGIIDALKGMDVNVLIGAIAGFGLMSGMMILLSSLSGFVPGALVGVLGVGAVIAELAIVLAAIGALAQIPGLDWLINEGGKLLESIGVAIGSFIGGIIGGVAKGVTGQFPAIGQDLSDFMTNVQPFVDGAKKIDNSVIDGVKALADVVLTLTAANIVDGLASWLTGGSSLADFGAEIAAFGPQIKAFADSVAGINVAAVTAATGAAKALAEMTNVIPNQGGVVGWFTGENSLAKFGKELVSFGVSLKAYSVAVTGIDIASVAASTTAAKALATMANTVPNEGGVIGWFAGENSLAKFGTEIVTFGVCLKAYSVAVAGLDVAAVSTSTTAAKALADLANNVPNEGGVKAWFAGDNSIAAFGDQIVSFGADFAAYSVHMKGVDANVVAATSNAATSLVTLANGLPDNKFFKNETTLDEFGKQLSKFGKEFANYYNSISGINATTLSSTVTEVWRLLNLFTQMSNSSFSGVSDFKKALNDLAKTGIDEFVNAFSGSATRVNTAVTSLMNAAITAVNTQKTNLSMAFTSLMDGALTAINNKQPEFQTRGMDTVVKFVAGVRSQTESVKMVYVSVLTSVLTAIKNKYHEFESVGKATMTKFIGGVKSNTSSINTAFTSNIGSALSAIKDYYDEFYDAGEYLVEGFIEGVEDNEYKVERVGSSTGIAALRGLNESLDEHSPSREAYKSGRFFYEGFANALYDRIGKAEMVGNSVGEAAKRGLLNAVSRIRDTIDSELDTQPVIRPVLDLSEINKDSLKILDVVSTTASAEKVNTSVNSGRISPMNVEESLNKFKSELSKAGGVSFVQNNYSPKALSRVEIYRQTNNQFSAFQKAVTTRD